MATTLDRGCRPVEGSSSRGPPPLFPLPVTEAFYSHPPRGERTALPRYKAQRAAAADRRSARAIEAITTLNGMAAACAGRDVVLRPPQRTGSADIAQESALRRIRRRIAAFGERPADLDGAGALQVLLKTTVKVTV